MTLVERIIATTEPWGGWKHQNSQLELASMALEARLSENVDGLKDIYLKQLANTLIRKGVYKRSPDCVIANSHDNIVCGIGPLSLLFDKGQTARDILDQGLLYLSGKNEHGKAFDLEWLMLLRPEYKAMLKIAAGRKPSWFERKALEANVRLSKVWNIKRVQLLFFAAAGYEEKWMGGVRKDLATKYKGRYIADKENPTLPIYLSAWEANRGRYS